MKAVTRGTTCTDWIGVTRPMKVFSGATFWTCTGTAVTAGGGADGAGAAACAADASSIVIAI